MPAKPAECFRKRLAEIIEERGLTMEDLGRLSDTSRPGISRILSGKEQVTLERAGRIAKALHVDLADMISTDKKILQESA